MKYDYQPVYAEESKKVESAVKKAVKKMKIKASDSTYDKVKKAHDWLIFNFEYDVLFWNYYKDDYADYTEEMLKEVKTHKPWDLEWAFENHLANCSAYSRIFKMCMDEIGIECIYVSSKEMNHAWNMVLMDDGHWYHIDVTFDDPDCDGMDSQLGGYSTKYFLRNDECFPGHYGWDKDAPKADGDYYEKNVNHDISYTRSAKDKYWKNGNIKVSYGNRSYCTDCVSKFYKNGNLKYTKYTYIESGTEIIMKYDKNGKRIYRQSKNSDGETYVYEGEFDDSGMVGDANGKIYREDGSLAFDYFGEFNGYKWNGKGIVSYYNEDGSLSYTYEGDFVDYVRNGEGVYRSFNPDGSIGYIYDGTFVEGDFEGTGKFTAFYESGNKKVSEGVFSNWSLKSGTATWYDAYGNITYVENY